MKIRPRITMFYLIKNMFRIFMFWKYFYIGDNRAEIS